MKMRMLASLNKAKPDEENTRGLGPRLRQDKHNTCMLYTTRTDRSLVYFTSSVCVTKKYYEQECEATTESATQLILTINPSPVPVTLKPNYVRGGQKLGGKKDTLSDQRESLIITILGVNN
jgi:hypothetical protein